MNAVITARAFVSLVALATLAGCIVDPPNLSGKGCESDAECGALACIDGACGPPGSGVGEGEGEGAEGEAAEGEGEAGEGEGEGDEGEGEGEGEPPLTDFEAWAPNQPDNAAQDCLAASYGVDLVGRTWRDRNCAELFPFICDIVDVAPEGCELVDIGKSVALCPQLLAFVDAEAACETVGGSLARITSVDQNAALLSAAASILPATPGVAFLGANDIDVENDWRWLDGTPLFVPVFSPWEDGAPESGTIDEDCLELGMEVDDIGTWQDILCTQVSPYVCSLPANADPGLCTPVDVGNKRFSICVEPLAVADARDACLALGGDLAVGSSRVDLQACKLEYSIVSPK